MARGLGRKAGAREMMRAVHRRTPAASGGDFGRRFRAAVSGGAFDG
jgi:hypothetical protein